MSDIFVARQPIFTKDQRVFAYELLFRSAQGQTAYLGQDGNQATAQVLTDSLLEFGFMKLTNHRTAFVNFPADMLMEPFVAELPSNMIAIEILETVPPTPAIVYRCKELKEKGFRLALDDFVFSPVYKDLIALADYIKVDFRTTPGSERQALVKQLARPGLAFLAEKVETAAEYREAVACGYELIQGYFFGKPDVLSGRTVRLLEQSAVLFMQELLNKDVDYKRLEEILRRDISLSYKILRFINSSYFGFKMEITSIRQALILIGKQELYKWSSLWVLSSLSMDKPPELLRLSLVRARFAELIGEEMKRKNTHEFFLCGMFSLIDAFLDRPMVEIVSELPVRQYVKEAMTGGHNLLAIVLQLVGFYEQADWENGAKCAAKLGLTEEKLADAYYRAQLWKSLC